MSVTARPSGIRSRSGAAILEFELLQEAASALGRLGRALEAALGHLSAFDECHPGPALMAPAERQARRVLVVRAAGALWNLTVQREACGLRGTEALMRDYRVPPEVYGAMGARPDPV